MPALRVHWSSLSLLALVVAFGCSGTASKGTTPATASDTEVSKPVDTRSKGEVGYAKAGAQACMLHAQAGGYFRCLSGSDGQCFHYGATCVPKSSCMYDKDTQQHKLCEESQSGTCMRYGATCAPEDRCMYSPADNRYRQCAASKDGSCPSFGETCQPAS